MACEALFCLFLCFFSVLTNTGGIGHQRLVSQYERRGDHAHEKKKEKKMYSTLMEKWPIISCIALTVLDLLM